MLLMFFNTIICPVIVQIVLKLNFILMNKDTKTNSQRDCWLQTKTEEFMRDPVLFLRNLWHA